VLQAQVRMAQVLRADPGSIGLVSAVSGILTKQGVGLWSSEPRGPAFGFDDVSAETANQVERVEVIDAAPGEARIASYTVLYDKNGDGGGDGPSSSIALCDLADGQRTLVVSGDRELAAELERGEACGRLLSIQADGSAKLS